MQLDTELERRTIAYSLELRTAHTHADHTNATVVPDAAVAAPKGSTGKQTGMPLTNGSGREEALVALANSRWCSERYPLGHGRKGTPYEARRSHKQTRSQLDTIYSAASSKLRCCSTSMITVSQPSCTSSHWRWLFRVSASFAPPCASDSPATPERAEPNPTPQRMRRCTAQATADKQWQGETALMRFRYRRFHGVLRSSPLVHH